MKPERLPSRRRFDRKTPDTPWWLTRLREHPVKSLGTATLITGGLFVLLLFAHIGSSPELDLSGATATLLAVAIVGAIVNVVFACGALAMGWAMRSEDRSHRLDATRRQSSSICHARLARNGLRHHRALSQSELGAVQNSLHRHVRDRTSRHSDSGTTTCEERIHPGEIASPMASSMASTANRRADPIAMLPLVMSCAARRRHLLRDVPERHGARSSAHPVPRRVGRMDNDLLPREHCRCTSEA